ncbi:hypothetical protein Slala05_15690 [Streptomyces lavendulae subsp. lavendulae]|nr:hypothetical protein Slala05_15690 [Streptomyces lavendulae subsp. lavendulae]
MREMAAEGRHRIAVLATSAYASYSGCRQYRENLADALALLVEGGVAEADLPGRREADRRRGPRRDRHRAPWELVYQSHSGAAHIPWLEPDI